MKGIWKIILDRCEIVPLSLTAPDSVEGRPQNNLIRMTDQFWVYLYLQTKHAQNNEHSNSTTKRNKIKRRIIRAIYYSRPRFKDTPRYFFGSVFNAGKCL